MRKLKKSSTSKPLFKVVVFYGTFAVGKYTVAKEFQRQMGYKFFHNHQVFDIAISLFERKTIHLSRLYENLNFTILKEIASAKIDTVTTHAFSAKYISRTGLSDPLYMKRIESIVEKAGGITYFVHLKADTNILLKRVKGNSRKKFIKLKDSKILETLLKDKTKDWTTTAPVKNNLQIDNTKLSPQKVVDTIIKYFKL